MKHLTREGGTRVRFSLAPVILTRLLALVNARSSRSLPRVCFRLRLSLSVWAHEPQSCCAASSISCPLLTSIHISSPTHLPPPGPPPSLLVRCLRRWFRLGNRQLSRKWEAAPVRRGPPVSVVQGPSRDGGGLRSTPAGGVGGRGVDGQGLVRCGL